METARPGATPIQVAGKFVVVTRDPLAEEAEDVLVDEVEPEEAVAVFSTCISQTGEDVPGGRDEQEESEAGEGFQAAPLCPGAGEGEVNQSRAEEEDERDEALGEDGEGQGRST